MNTAHAELFESVLALPQTERADLAFRLLHSLDPPGADAASANFGAELRERVIAARRGEIDSVSLAEAREVMNQRFGKRTES